MTTMRFSLRLDGFKRTYVMLPCLKSFQGIRSERVVIAVEGYIPENEEQLKIIKRAALRVLQENGYQPYSFHLEHWAYGRRRENPLHVIVKRP